MPGVFCTPLHPQRLKLPLSFLCFVLHLLPPYFHQLFVPVALQHAFQFPLQVRH
jgi:hypothetical protein